MLAKEIAQKLDGRLVVDGEEFDIKDFYAGDFLSRVMGKAPSDCAWFTVMGNINVAGVAVLAEAKAVILCEGVDASALTDKLREENISLISTPLSVYEAIRRLPI